MNIFEDQKITMLPVVFTKKLDKMDSISTNWEPLSFKKITTMLLEESKPKYNRCNISTSTSTIVNKESYSKLENKLNSYFLGLKPRNNTLNFDLESIIEKALNNITTSTASQNVQKVDTKSSIKIEHDIDSWSSDDDKTLISAKRKKNDTTTVAEMQSQSTRNTPNSRATMKEELEYEKDILITAEKPFNDLGELEKDRSKLNSKLCQKKHTQKKATKTTTTVAEVQSQLKKSTRNTPTPKMEEEYEYEYENGILINVNRKIRRPSKNQDHETRKKCKVTTNDKNINNAISIKRKYQSQKKKNSKLPAKQKEKKGPVDSPNTNQNKKKKIRPQDVGPISIYFCNIGLMAKQQKVTKERYDIGTDGNLEKFFVRSQPPKDCRRHLIEKTVCCLYRRALVITEILDEYDINPTAVNFLRSTHLCEVGACLCCCKPTRSIPQSNMILLPSQTKRYVESSSVLPNEPHASSSVTSIQGKNTYAADKVMKYLLAHNFKLSFALKGLLTTLLTNFQGITLTTSSTGKLSAVFNTTFSSWGNTDIQLTSTILMKLRKELCASKIPPEDFCNCVNKALVADDSYVEASKLLGSKQFLMRKSLNYFTNPKKVMKQKEQEDETIEYFRGHPKLLQNAVTGGTRKTMTDDKKTTEKRRKRITRNTKTRTKGKQKDKSPEALRECVFVPETITKDPTETVNDVITATIKSPILQQMLSNSALQYKSPDKFGVTQVPLQYLVSVPVTDDNSKHVPQYSVPRSNSIAIDVVDLISDDEGETILP